MEVAETPYLNHFIYIFSVVFIFSHSCIASGRYGAKRQIQESFDIRLDIFFDPNLAFALKTFKTHCGNLQCGFAPFCFSMEVRFLVLVTRFTNCDAETHLILCAKALGALFFSCRIAPLGRLGIESSFFCCISAGAIEQGNRVQG